MAAYALQMLSLFPVTVTNLQNSEQEGLSEGWVNKATYLSDEVLLEMFIRAPL